MLKTPFNSSRQASSANPQCNVKSKIVQQDKMMIEQSTNYAYKLKYMDNPTFDKVRDLSTKFYRELPQALQDELFEALNRGIDILDTEPQMAAYMFAFGKMHQAKLSYAFGKLSKEFLEQPEINIIDYGCGQALGTMCYADFVRNKGCTQKVKTITLIEPSEICLKRAALHASVFFPDTEIKTVNKSFDDLTQDDIVCNEETPTLHILSNVLDMLNFDLDKFSAVIKDSLNGYNQFVCIGPYFSDYIRDERMNDFAFHFCNDYMDEILEKRELNAEKNWTCQITCFIVKASSNSYSLASGTTKEPKDAVQDSAGVLYSLDGERLLKNNNWHISEYSIKEGTKEICDYAFSNCEIKSISIPNSVRTIGKNAFNNCWDLESVDLPDSVVSIGESAFSGCTNLKSVHLSWYVLSIGDYSFFNCPNLKLINIPKSVTTIGVNPFCGYRNTRLKIYSNSSQFLVDREFLIDNVEKRLISYFGQGTRICVPSNIKYVGDSAFYGCETITQVTIPDTVVSIGSCSFHGCKSLQTINIPNSVTYIGEASFSRCSSLSEIVIPDSIQSIEGSNPFNECENISIISLSNRFVINNEMLIDIMQNRLITYFGKREIVTIPDDSVRIIGAHAFMSNKRIKRISIPNSVLTIENSAFCNCKLLESIRMSNAISSIGKWAFSECESLTDIIIPDSVSSVEEGTFSRCKSLRSVSLPNSLKSIGFLSFAWCESLFVIEIPDSVNSIGDGAFWWCTSLHFVYIQQGSLEKFKKLFPQDLWEKLWECQTKYVGKNTDNNTENGNDLPF